MAGYPDLIPNVRPRGKDCMNCKHGDFVLATGMVHCTHPERPVPKGQAHGAEVIRWAVGCPQHELKESR
jgi:hypothetical protein